MRLSVGLAGGRAGERQSWVHQCSFPNRSTFGGGLNQFPLGLTVAAMLLMSWYAGTIDANSESVATVDVAAFSATSDDFVMTRTAGADVVVGDLKLGDGHQTILRIDSADAPSMYRFDNAIPVDVTATTMTDGSLLLGDGSAIAAPWAFDATGAAVATWYEVDGTTFIQHIDHSSVTAYQVVADPCWKFWKCTKKLAGAAVVGAAAGCAVGAILTFWAVGAGCGPAALQGAVMITAGTWYNSSNP